ncbi:MAG: glycosyltransferase family 4 protein [bacterium]
MKVLLVNNFFYDRGGDCTYFFSLKKLLEEKGHQTMVFSMHHPLELDSNYSKYFVSYIDYAEEVKSISLISGLRVLQRAVFSQEAKAKIEKLIKDEKPDIAHLQNIHHHITPSILYSLRRNKIPVIWTLHDYTLICPNTSFLCHGKICERCKKIKYYWSPIVRCKKKSFAASAMAAIESTIHLIMGIRDLVDSYIAPSYFMKKKTIDYGLRSNKVVHINSFIDSNTVKHQASEGDYYLYVGRLSEEKGVKTLIDAAVRVVDLGLEIIGDGPLAKELNRYANSKDRKDVIGFLGHRNHKEVIKYLANCRFAVTPSEWYENLPYSILETFACGKPVIGARIGGIPELVVNGETGLLFEPGNAEDLAEKIQWMFEHPEECREMGRKARMLVEMEYTPELHYKRLMEVYRAAFAKHGKDITKLTF